MKKTVIKTIITIVAIVVFAVCMLSFGACNKQSNSVELTDLEKEIVGTWQMNDAKLQYRNYSNAYFYPEGPQGFRSAVAKYYKIAKITFYAEKISNGKLKGELVVNGEKQTFGWSRQAKKVISLDSSIELYYGTDSSMSTARIDTIYIASDGTYLDIMFDGNILVFYYFDKI